MKFLTKNTIVIGRVIVILFFVASSGFTAVLQICTMEASQCCDRGGADDHHGCPVGETSLPLAGASIQNSGDCLIIAVVGGLAAYQALLEKENKAQSVKALVLFVSAGVSLTADSNTSSFILATSERVTPHSVEKYVLNETFLI